MAYSNLRAEMARKNITQEHISDKLGIAISGVSARMSGKSKFKFDEAVIIHESFFPDEDFKYLFDQDSAS